MTRKERLKACAVAGIMVDGETIRCVIDNLGIYSQYAILLTRFGLPAPEDIEDATLYPLANLVNLLNSPLVNSSIKKAIGRAMMTSTTKFDEAPVPTVDGIMGSFDAMYVYLHYLSNGDPVIAPALTIGNTVAVESQDTLYWTITSTSVWPIEVIEGYLQGVGFRFTDNRVAVALTHSDEVTAIYRMTKRITQPN